MTDINKCNFLDSTLSTSTSTSWDERFIESQYRSGNAQRAYSGQEYRRLSIGLDFVPMSYTDKKTLEDFYLAVGMVKYFLWTPIDSDYDASSEQKVWRFSRPINIYQIVDKYTADVIVEEVPNGTADKDDSDEFYTADTTT